MAVSWFGRNLSGFAVGAGRHAGVGVRPYLSQLAGSRSKRLLTRLVRCVQALRGELNSQGAFYKC